MCTRLSGGNRRLWGSSYTSCLSCDTLGIGTVPPYAVKPLTDGIGLRRGDEASLLACIDARYTADGVGGAAWPI